MADSDHRDGFLRRWSGRKRQARRPARESPTVESPPSQDPEESQAGSRPRSEEEIVARLPEIESLDDTSDFTAFLEQGVPEALRRKALRKLWRVNPVLANLDGLNDYDDDYTVAEPVIAGLKTLYQAGKGMVAEDGEGDKTPEDQARQDPGQGPGQGSDSEEFVVAEGATEAVPTPPDAGNSAPEDAAPEDKGAPAEAPTPEAPARGTARKRRWGQTSD